MLKLKDLQRRVYDGKRCVRFSYPVTVESGGRTEELFEAEWKAGDSPDAWSMVVVLPTEPPTGSQVYTIVYVMPRAGMPLELVAATGLKLFQTVMQQEVQGKIAIDFAIGDTVAGM